MSKNKNKEHCIQVDLVKLWRVLKKLKAQKVGEMEKNRDLWERKGERERELLEARQHRQGSVSPSATRRPPTWRSYHLLPEQGRNPFLRDNSVRKCSPHKHDILSLVVRIHI